MSHASYDAFIRAFADSWWERVMRPAMAVAFERCYELGVLPLPDLSWGPRAIWYRGDLV